LLQGWAAQLKTLMVVKRRTFSRGIRSRAEIEQLKETIRAFGRGDIVPITDKDAEIERLRAALKTVQTFIAGEQIAHALVPEGDGGPDTWPTLGKVIARAFEQKASER
jgi:hypothetical protein